MAGAKHLALEGTDLQILLACPFFYSAPDTDAFLTSIRGAVQAQCGQAYYATVDYPRSKVPHMRVVFYATPAALHVKCQLAAEGCLRLYVGGTAVQLPVRLVPGLKPPGSQVLIAHYPVGPAMLHSDFWKVVLTAAGYHTAAASCTASFLPSHAGGDPSHLDASKIIAFAVPPLATLTSPGCPGSSTMTLARRMSSSLWRNTRTLPVNGTAAGPSPMCATPQLDPWSPLLGVLVLTAGHASLEGGGRWYPRRSWAALSRPRIWPHVARALLVCRAAGTRGGRAAPFAQSR